MSHIISNNYQVSSDINLSFIYYNSYKHQVIHIQLKHEYMSDLFGSDLGEVAVEESSDVFVHRGSFLVRLHLYVRWVTVVEGVLYHGGVAAV